MINKKKKKIGCKKRDFSHPSSTMQEKHIKPKCHLIITSLITVPITGQGFKRHHPTCITSPSQNIIKRFQTI